MILYTDEPIFRLDLTFCPLTSAMGFITIDNIDDYSGYIKIYIGRDT